MSYRNAVLIFASLLAVSSPAVAQSQPAGQGKTLAAATGVYVFPREGQSAEKQSVDEATCYDWAVNTAGVDPFELQKVAQQQAQQAEAAKQQAAGAGRGSGAKGGLIGAAAGALIGEIADNDAGKGAAYGAAAGVIAGRRRGRAKEEQATRQVEQQAQQAQAATAEQVDGFRKAFAACLEAKQYVAKF